MGKYVYNVEFFFNSKENQHSKYVYNVRDQRDKNDLSTNPSYYTACKSKVSNTTDNMCITSAIAKRSVINKDNQLHNVSESPFIARNVIDQSSSAINNECENQTDISCNSDPWKEFRRLRTEYKNQWPNRTPEVLPLSLIHI